MIFASFLFYMFSTAAPVQYIGTAGTELEEDRGERKVIDEED